MNTRDARLAALWGFFSLRNQFVRLVSQLLRPSVGTGMSWTTVTLSFGPAGVVDLSRSLSALRTQQTCCFLLTASTPVRSVEKSTKRLPTSPSVSLRGSTCTEQPSIPRLAWSFRTTEVCTKDPMTPTTNAQGGLSLLNSGEKRLNQSTVCAPSAVIQSVSTLITYA